VSTLTTYQPGSTTPARPLPSRPEGHRWPGDTPWARHRMPAAPPAPSTPLSVYLFSGPSLVAWGYMLILAGAELVATFVDPRLGIVSHAILLITMLIHGALKFRKPTGRILAVFTIAPLIRLLSLILPLSTIPVILWYPIVALPLFVSGIVAAVRLGLSMEDIGFKLGWPVMQVGFSVVGVSLGMIEYSILHSKPIIQPLNLLTLSAGGIVLLTSTGILEEFLFRGVIQGTLRPLLGPLTIWVVSAMFATLHIGYASLPNLVFVFGVGMLFSIFVEKTRSLVGVSLAHGMINLMAMVLLPAMAQAMS
jgi:membrane protease YdiL (CAAX protease family)